MQKIRILDVSFQNPIEPWEVSYFRGAVIKLAGRQHILFHNHKQEGFRYSYPLIQYKRIDRKPHLTCINEGIEDVYNFFDKMQEGILLNRRPYNLVVENINLNYFTLQVWDASFRYYLQEWMSLNTKNVIQFNELENEQEQKEFLSSILIGNILSMAKGVSWNIDKQIELSIEKIKGIRKVRIKGVEMLLITATFISNVSLPAGIGIGKNAGTGYGIVRKLGNV